MPEEHFRFHIKITNRGGEADKHRIRLIDAGDMYAGLHRAMSYVALSYIHGELVERASFESEVQIYQKQTTDNCLIHDIIVEIAKSSAAVLGAAITINVASNLITDLFKTCVKSAAGISESDSKSTRVPERVEPFFDELVSKAEPHIRAIHAPIHQEETIELVVGGSDPITLDIETKDYVSTSTPSRRSKIYTGNVSRLNLITGNGRFFCNELKRVVPFAQPADFKGSVGSRRLSWSLREKDRGHPAELRITVNEVKTRSGRIKRFIVRKVQK